MIDPRPFAAGSVRDVYRDYPHLGPVLPAVGYSRLQLAALAETIDASDAEVVVSATPCDLAALVPIGRPVVRARYRLDDLDGDLARALERFVNAL